MWDNLKFTKPCKDSPKSTLMALTQYLLLFTSSVIMGQLSLSKLRSKHWGMIFNYSPDFIWIVLVFSLMPFSCFNLGCHMVFGCLISLVSSGLWQYIWAFPCALITLTTLRNTDQIFNRMFLNLVLSNEKHSFHLTIHQPGFWFCSNQTHNFDWALNCCCEAAPTLYTEFL